MIDRFFTATDWHGTTCRGFAREDHQKLADALRRFVKARVVVSYYAHPDLAELYPGWNVLETPTPKAMSNVGQRQSGTKNALEVLIVNESPTTPAVRNGLFATPGVNSCV